MMIYDKSCGDIIILDNFVRIYVDENSENIFGKTISGDHIPILDCDSEEQALKIIKDIYTKMTYGSENMIINLEDYRIHCIDCIKYKTDACTIWGNLDPQDTICIDFLEEEAKIDVNEEK